MSCISATTKIFCVIGNPIKHSRSPIIHNFIFKKIRFNAVYIAFEVKKLKNFFSFVRDVNISGISITIPYKVESIKFVDELDETANKILAINTVKNTNRKLIGYNTDIEGVIKSFTTKGINSLNGKKALILGSGGVSRAVIFALVQLGISSITITNRNIEKSQKLANEISKYFSNIEVEEWIKRNNLVPKHDVIANCTPIGMVPNIYESPVNNQNISQNHIVFDAIYTPINTKLITNAINAGAKVAFGIDMFVFQALSQSRIWTENSEIYSFKDSIIKLLDSTEIT